MVSTTETSDNDAALPLGGTRTQALQRLQVGVSLLVGIVLIVGLANVIEERAKLSEETAVPEAAATVEPAAVAAPAVDPLADAGVVPDLPAEDSPVPPDAAPTSAGTAAPVDAP